MLSVSFQRPLRCRSTQRPPTPRKRPPVTDCSTRPVANQKSQSLRYPQRYPRNGNWDHEICLCHPQRICIAIQQLIHASILFWHEAANGAIESFNDVGISTERQMLGISPSIDQSRLAHADTSGNVLSSRLRKSSQSHWLNGSSEKLIEVASMSLEKPYCCLTKCLK